MLKEWQQWQNKTINTTNLLGWSSRIHRLSSLQRCKTPPTRFPDMTQNNLMVRLAVVSILLYGCNTWTLTKRLKKKLDGNYTKMLRAILNKSWRQHSTRHQLYGHLTPITKTIQVRRTRHAGHCWRSKDELIGDVLLWTPRIWPSKSRTTSSNIQQLCEDTGCSPEDLPEAKNDREKWRERVRDIGASGTTWWWWMLKLSQMWSTSSL